MIFSTFQSIFADEPDEIQGIVFQPHFLSKRHELVAFYEVPSYGELEMGSFIFRHPQGAGVAERGQHNLLNY